MAGSYRSHFADPHTLRRLYYSSSSTCNICLSNLAGQAGYRCNVCDFDIHEACADNYKPTITFFAHPWHTLKARRIPRSDVGWWSWVCDLCGEKCPPGSLVYRCIGCMFDVHPCCTRLPQTIRSSLHPQHDVCMVPSSGVCTACNKYLPVWQYICGGSCKVRFHIACVAGAGR